MGKGVGLKPSTIGEGGECPTAMLQLPAGYIRVTFSPWYRCNGWTWALDHWMRIGVFYHCATPSGHLSLSFWSFLLPRLRIMVWIWTFDLLRSRVIYHCASSLGLHRRTFSIHFVSPRARGLSWTRAFDLGVRRQVSCGDWPLLYLPWPVPGWT